jgi:hypothetical protein
MTGLEKLGRVPLGAWLALCVMIAAIAAILRDAPEAMWPALAGADWTHIAGVILLVGGNAATVLALFRVAWKGEMPKAAVLRAPSGDREATARRSREGSADWPLLAIVLGVALMLAAVLSGCGASPMQVQWSGVRVAGTVLDSAVDVAEAGLTAQVGACATIECAESVRADWRPVQLASAALVMGLQGWGSTLSVIDAAGGLDAPAVLWRAVAREIDAFGQRWRDFALALGALGVDVPVLPPEVLAVAAAIGGAR